MARLLIVAPDRWALKGGVALDFRLGIRARTTRDMDLAWLESEGQADRDLIDAQSLDLGDHFAFRVEQVRRDQEAGERTARYRVWVDLAGRRYTEIAVALNFHGELWGPLELVEPPAYLHFSGLDAAPVPTLSLKQHIAEKCHAYTRIYASGPSSRSKDLIDLVLIALHTRPDARQLRQTLEGIFGRRNTHELPNSLPRPPEGWGAPYQQLASTVGIDPDVGVGHHLAASLVDPVLSGQVQYGKWSHSEGQWTRSK